MKIVAIVQARMGSTRLPGKVIMDLEGEPALVRCINRLKRAKCLDEIVIATTNKKRDKVIVDLCIKKRWKYFRGNEDDVLDRYYQAAKAFQGDIIVRVTSDCPLIEPTIVDAVVTTMIEHFHAHDYTANNLTRTFPIGLDTEAFTIEALERAWKEDKNPAWREHVTPYIRFHPEIFSYLEFQNDKDLSYMRWTLDTKEDLEFLRRIYKRFNGKDDFSWKDVLKILENEPELCRINAHVKQKVII